jgi:hypothetical protein
MTVKMEITMRLLSLTTPFIVVKMTMKTMRIEDQIVKESNTHNYKIIVEIANAP